MRVSNDHSFQKAFAINLIYTISLFPIICHLVEIYKEDGNLVYTFKGPLKRFRTEGKILNPLLNRYQQTLDEYIQQ